MTSRPHVDLRSFIREVPDFPQPGIVFRDITPLLHEPAAYRYVIDELARRIAALSALRYRDRVPRLIPEAVE